MKKLVGQYDDFTPEDVARKALEQHPNNVKEAVSWAMAFLRQHPRVKAALEEPLLQQAMKESIDITIQLERRECTPRVNAPHPAPRDPRAEQRMADALESVRARARLDWLRFQMRKGLLSSNERRELDELRRKARQSFLSVHAELTRLTLGVLARRATTAGRGRIPVPNDTGDPP
jgi:hypothetical protein